jgi:phosphatidylethanolamine-binding protein (PEBP) family uncharacterized protein
VTREPALSDRRPGGNRVPSRSWSTTPTTYGFTHHVLYNISATAAELTTQTSAMAGSNTAGAGTYLAPALPPGHGHHSYYFEFYPLDAGLALPAGLDPARQRRPPLGRRETGRPAGRI